MQNVSGRIAYIINGKAVVLSEKDILLIISNIPHTWMAEDKTVCTSIAYYPVSYTHLDVYKRQS